MAVATLVLVGCSSSTSTHTTDAGTGALAGVPEYPGSSSFGPATVRADMTVHSFKVENATPKAILRWYAAHLEGWTRDRVPTRNPASTDVVGRWKRTSRHLQVSAATAPAAGATQYTLVGTTGGAPLP